MFDLKDRAALITGASGGIGGAIARAFHQLGAQVALSGRRRDRLEALAQELGGRAHILPCALEDPEAVKELPRQAEAQMGGVDILVNNAGLTRDGLAIRMSDEDWNEVIRVDLTAGFLLARGVLRGMIRRRRGRIISITSVVAAAGNPGQANYAAAKAGITGMTKALAQEVAARGITVNCIAPGFIETAMTEALSGDQRTALAARIPAGRFGQPQDIAAAAAFLAADAAAYITGQTFHINGGMAMP